MFHFFGHEASEILAPRPGIEPTPPALEGQVLITGPPGQSRAETSLHHTSPTSVYWTWQLDQFT